MTEIWKDVKNYEGLYQVSNLGRVKSLEKYDRLGRFHPERILRDCDNGTGYRVVNLKHDGHQQIQTVHKLVADAFLPNEEEYSDINHLDGNKANNVITNLERCSHSSNMVHAVTTGLHTKYGQRKVMCVELALIFNSVAEAERWVGVKGSRISNVCNRRHGCKTCGGYHWRYV